MKKIAIAFLVVLAACGPATQITASWKNPNEKPRRFNTIMVAALTSNLEARQTVENNLSQALNATGRKTLKSIESIPPGFLDDKDIDKEELLKKIRKAGADGILTVTLINKDTENRYVPESLGYAPVTRFGYYGRFSGYYTTWYPTVISPGYYEETQVYFIETNLYDAASEDLLWSAQSEIYNPSSLTGFSKDFAEVVVSKMKKDGVLK
jgi:hypothetical protein